MLEHYWQAHGRQRYTVLGLLSGGLAAGAELFQSVISNSLESLLRQVDFVVTVENSSEYDHSSGDITCKKDYSFTPRRLP
jgi:hypothetical protein